MRVQMAVSTLEVYARTNLCANFDVRIGAILAAT
jgi:hypothetical protein